MCKLVLVCKLWYEYFGLISESELTYVRSGSIKFSMSLFLHKIILKSLLNNPSLGTLQLISGRFPVCSWNSWIVNLHSKFLIYLFDGKVSRNNQCNIPANFFYWLQWQTDKIGCSGELIIWNEVMYLACSHKPWWLWWFFFLRNTVHWQILFTPKTSFTSCFFKFHILKLFI